MLLLCLLLCVLIKDSYQACGASNPNQTIGQPYLTISLAPPIDDYNFQPCAGNYETYANSGNPTQGLGNLKINNFDRCTGTTLTLKNTDPQETVFCVVKTQADAESDPCKSAISSTPMIKIVWTQTTGCLSQFTGTLSNTSALAGSTPAPATTPPFTTRQYTPGVIDPYLVSHDLYFGIDLGAKPDDATFGEMISLANNFAQLLNIVDGPFNVTPPAYTRASVLELTPHNSYSTSAGIWEQTKNTLNNVFSGMIYKTGVPANYADTLRLAIPDAYLIRIGEPDYVKFARGTRSNAQRTFTIFTNQLPGDFNQLKLSCDDTGSICSLFKQYDVHLLIVGYKVPVADDAAFSDPDNWFSYTSVTNNDITTAMLIINGFFTNADGLCRNDQETELFVGQQFSTTLQPPIPAVIKEPKDYSGPTIDDSETTWGTENGQKYRYCNFHNNQYFVRNMAYNTKVNPTCLMIFHDLEIERDFLRAYEIGDNDYELTEIASFTGRDVLGSIIQSTKNISLIFSTDYKEVFGGFYVYASVGANQQCDRLTFYTSPSTTTGASTASTTK